MSLEASLKAELAALKARATTRTLVAAALVLAALAAFGISAWVASQARRQVADYGQRAAVADAAAGAARDRAEQAESDQASARARVQALEREVAAAKARLAATPRPEPVPVNPPEDAALKAELAALLQEPPRQRVDAIKIWDWHAEALRAPLLERRLGACEALAGVQERQLNAQGEELTACSEASAEWKRAAGAERVRAEALQGQVKAMTTELRAERWKKWLLVGGAAAAGFFAGRK